MSSKKYATPLRLEIAPSRFLFVLLAALHLAAIALFYILAFSDIVLILVTLLILCSAYVAINKHALLSSVNSTVELIWDGDNDWILERRCGENTLVELMPDSYVHPSITILLFKDASKKYPKLFPINVILLKDNVGANDFRRLRVRLKVAKPIDARS